MTMTTLLAIDTSAAPVSCAVWRDGRLLATYYSHTARTHSQTLMPMVQNALETAGLTMQQIDALAVSHGPGSFTGVRIGVAAVKGLAFAENKPCVAVSTLEAMARPLAGLPFEGLICCVMDARCGQVYTAVFTQNADGTQCRQTPDEAVPIENVKNRLLSQKKSVILVGDGSEMCYNALKDVVPHLFLAPAGLRFQSAAGVAAVAAERLAAGETMEAAALLPLYLRLPQAERELRARQAAADRPQP